MDQNSENKQQPEHDEVPPGEPYYDVVLILEDGTEAAKIGELYYPLKKNGKPNFDRPIHDPK
jgi:hypothetical protein